MQTQRSAILLSVFSFCLLMHFAVNAQQNPVPSKAEVEKWFSSRAWSKGLKLKPHRTVNATEFYQQYHLIQKAWDTAFAFLRGQDLHALAAGKYNLMGDSVFATITEAATKDKDSVLWESHKKYIDLQFVAEGKEQIGVADASKAKVIKPYTVDAMNYDTEGTFYISSPDTFFLFFPNDAHRPSIKTPGADRVKKVVIKILYVR